jgi:hypothetical protein
MEYNPEKAEYFCEKAVRIGHNPSDGIAGDLVI